MHLYLVVLLVLTKIRNKIFWRIITIMFFIRIIMHIYCFLNVFGIFVLGTITEKHLSQFLRRFEIKFIRDKYPGIHIFFGLKSIKTNYLCMSWNEKYRFCCCWIVFTFGHLKYSRAEIRFVWLILESKLSKRIEGDWHFVKKIPHNSPDMYHLGPDLRQTWRTIADTRQVSSSFFLFLSSLIGRVSKELWCLFSPPQINVKVTLIWIVTEC